MPNQSDIPQFVELVKAEEKLDRFIRKNVRENAAVKKAQVALQRAIAAAKESVADEVGEMKMQVFKLRAAYEQVNSDKVNEVPEYVSKFFQALHKAHTYGKPLVLRWESPLKRYVIWSAPGFGMPNGEYSPTAHYLSDLSKAEEHVGAELLKATTVVAHAGKINDHFESMVKDAKKLKGA